MTGTTITKEEVEALLDQSYNQGIDHALSIVKDKETTFQIMGWRDWHDTKHTISYEMKDAISKLESLKKV